MTSRFGRGLTLAVMIVTGIIVVGAIVGLASLLVQTIFAIVRAIAT